MWVTCSVQLIALNYGLHIVSYTLFGRDKLCHKLINIYLFHKLTTRHWSTNRYASFEIEKNFFLNSRQRTETQNSRHWRNGFADSEWLGDILHVQSVKFGKYTDKTVKNATLGSEVLIIYIFQIWEIANYFDCVIIHQNPRCSKWIFFWKSTQFLISVETRNHSFRLNKEHFISFKVAIFKRCIIKIYLYPCQYKMVWTIHKVGASFASQLINKSNATALKHVATSDDNRFKCWITMSEVPEILTGLWLLIRS